MKHARPNRRDVLKAAAVGGGALAGAGMFPGLERTALAASTLAPKTKHIVLVVFAGGVRTRETLGAPDNVPNLAAMAAEGVVYNRARTSNLGHFGATMSIFTGISEARGIRDNSRGADPTLFEYVRRDAELPAGQVWIATSGGAQQTNYSHSMHPEYGARFGANTLDGDGIFNREFKSLLDRYSRPKEMPPAEKAALAKMRGSMKKEGADEGAAEASAQVERYILDELTRGTSDLRGVNAGDAKALRVARNLVSLFKPKLVSVVLQNADIAHGSFNGYAEVIRRNDAMIGEIWNAVKADQELAESTAFFVLPEFGRDRDLNSRRGLDHGDGSDDLNYVSCVAWGPDFKTGREVGTEVRTIDVVPTICGMMGVQPRYARGKKLPGLFA